MKVVERLGTSRRRLQILSGLLELRKELREIGITRGFHWVDGSFVEDIEQRKQRAPDDIDIVTFFHRPPNLLTNHQGWRNLLNDNQHLFTPAATKLSFDCDAHYVDLDALATTPEELVKRTRYYFGLFSHRRDTYLWKGMLEVPLDDLKDDVDARALIELKDTA
ncbi:MAG: hypothetical protein IH602_22140 [Bryobacteraceae bacterium]|nr:hypothetical protein [Bryobacteraceae bacterium]